MSEKKIIKQQGKRLATLYRKAVNSGDLESFSTLVSTLDLFINQAPEGVTVENNSMLTYGPLASELTDLSVSANWCKIETLWLGPEAERLINRNIVVFGNRVDSDSDELMKSIMSHESSSYQATFNSFYEAKYTQVDVFGVRNKNGNIRSIWIAIDGIDESFSAVQPPWDMLDEFFIELLNHRYEYSPARAYSSLYSFLSNYYIPTSD